MVRRHDDVPMKRAVITTGAVAIAGGAASILFMPSCDPDCEVTPKPSVILQIVAKQPTSGTPNNIVVEDVWYEWTNDDGEKVSKQAECVDDMDDMDNGCTEWLVGDGGPGTYEYHATVCGQQYDSTVRLELNDDGCEVDTQIIELPVDGCPAEYAPEPPEPPEPGDPELSITQKVCTLEARPSVLVSVVGQVESHLQPLPADRVFYEVHEPPTPKQPTNAQSPQHPEHPNSGEMPGICLNDACTMFAAGFERTGDFEVGAEVCGQVITASVSVGETSNGCHVDTQHVQLMADASKCKPVQVAVSTPPPKPKPECGTQMTASAFVSPVTDGGDFWMPHPTEKLYFIHEGTRYEGYCAQKADNGKCKWWVTGWGLTGRFQAFTETCGVETGVTYSVEMSEDGCHPETQFVPVFVDTHGCIRSAWPPEGHPPPKTPAIAGEVSQ
jgi:hypothetical protein